MAWQNVRVSAPAGAQRPGQLHLTTTVTATAATNRSQQRLTTAHNTHPMDGNLAYATPEKRTVVRRRRSTGHLVYALRACPRDAPEPPSTANDGH
jgi:hypothetical protein